MEVKLKKADMRTTFVIARNTEALKLKGKVIDKDKLYKALTKQDKSYTHEKFQELCVMLGIL